MQANLSPPPVSVSQGLLWVLSPSGWALGWLGQAQPVLDPSWPQGEPPLECPAPDLGWALRQALGTREPSDVALHLLVCAGSTEARPPWWPDAGRRLKPWLELARDTRLRGVAARVMADELGTASLWEGARQAWDQARPLRRIDGWIAWVPHHPGSAFLASALLMTGLHAVLSGLVHPWLTAQRLALQAQAAQAHEEATARQAQARIQALEAERQSQTRAWQLRQSEAMAPLAQWLVLVDRVERGESTHHWTEMRWSQDAWTIWGLTSHAFAAEVFPFEGLTGWSTERIESAPTVWPASPEWGFPAWRYQVRVQAPRSERIQRGEGAP